MPKVRKYYAANGLAGCVKQTRSRKTKTLVGLYNGLQSGMDCEMPWVLVCEKHHGCVGHYSLAAAKSEMFDPARWCEYCQEEIKEDSPK